MSRSILVVEDSEAMRSLIGSILADVEVGDEDEFTIVEAQNGFEALKLLPRHRFEVILLDINMPDINGLELLNFLKSDDRYRNIPTVVISTEGKEEDRKRGLAMGANEYLIKPFDPDELVRIVRRLVQERADQ